MASVSARGVEWGSGPHQIIVPLTGGDRPTVLAQTRAAIDAGARVLEWRTDLYELQLAAPEHRRAVLELLPEMRQVLGISRCLLVTLRTAAEGGARSLDDQDLGELLEAAIVSGHADMVDVETARTAAVVEQVVDAAHSNGVLVVGSFHDLEATPAEHRIIELLRSQRRIGADIPKVAVTPHDPQDVLHLLSASAQVAADGNGPHIAISMGSLGAVSRVAGEVFGSAATFAAVGQTSAPGQLAYAEVVQMMDLLRP